MLRHKFRPPMTTRLGSSGEAQIALVPLCEWMFVLVGRCCHVSEAPLPWDRQTLEVYPRFAGLAQEKFGTVPVNAAVKTHIVPPLPNATWHGPCPAVKPPTPDWLPHDPSPPPVFDR